MLEITKEELKETIEHPDKIMLSDEVGLCCHVKKIRGKHELLVILGVDETGNHNYIKTYGWLQGMSFMPSPI